MLWLGTWRHMHYAHQRTCTRGRIPATVDIACRQEHTTNRFLTTHNCRRIFSSYTQYIYTKELKQSQNEPNGRYTLETQQNVISSGRVQANRYLRLIKQSSVPVRSSGFVVMAVHTRYVSERIPQFEEI